MLCNSPQKNIGNKKILLALAFSIFFLLNITSVFAVTYATVVDVFGILGDGTNRTGAYNVTFKVRSCDDSACSGESWSSLYTNATYNDISSLSNNRYFQYQALFYTEDQNYTPMLFNVTVGYTKNIYPTNVTLNVGNDSDIEWNQTGTFDYSVVIDDTNTTPTFTSELNDVLAGECSCSGCELNTTDRTCKIPFVLSSATQGQINISNINIIYDLMSLNITTIDQDSNPIENAYVEIFTPTGNSTAWKTAYTDSQGKASFTTITGKTYDIKSSKTGYISNTENTNVGPNGTYTLLMTALIDYIKVYLYDHNNNPLSGKTVNIYLANNATVYQTNTTDANGYAEFFVDVQNYDLEIDPTGWNRFYEDKSPPYTKILYGLLVNVTNQNSQAVNNAQVWVYEAGTTTSYNGNTNSSGMITFGLENQSYDISTFKQGVSSRLLRQNVPSTANIVLDLTVTEYLEDINSTVTDIYNLNTYWNSTYFGTWESYFSYWNTTVFPQLTTNTTSIYNYLTGTIKPQLDDIETDTNNLWLAENCTGTGATMQKCTWLQAIYNNVTDMQPRLYSLNMTQIPNIYSYLTNTINPNILSVNNSVANLWEYENCTYSPTSYKCQILLDINTTINEIQVTTNIINETSTTILGNIDNQTRVALSDFGEVSAGSKYRAKVWIYDFQGRHKAPSATPTITLYDPVRNIVVQGTSMSLVSTGIYDYEYTTSSSQTDGVWEAVVNVTASPSIYPSDYWELESSPAEVKINSMIDTTIPTITADVTITNEGSGAQEYQYEYCVVAEENNTCGGGDDIDYASGAKLIQAGQSWNTQLSLDEVNQTGTLWFKLLVYYGTEVSGASQSFTATTAPAGEEAPSTGGGAVGGRGGGVITPGPEPQEEIEVKEKEGKIEIIDFPKEIEIIKSESLEKTIGIKNIGDGNLNNVKLVISGLPLDSYSITPEKYDLIPPEETKTFTITFKADIEAKEYKIKFIVTSDEGSEEVNSILVIKEKKEPLISLLEIKISSQTLIIIGVGVLFIVILAVILWRQKGLKEQLQAMRKQITKSRTEEDVENDMTRIKKDLDALETMYKDDLMPESSYKSNREKLNKKLEELKEELSQKQPKKEIKGT